MKNLGEIRSLHESIFNLSITYFLSIVSVSVYHFADLFTSSVPISEADMCNEWSIERPWILPSVTVLGNTRARVRQASVCTTSCAFAHSTMVIPKVKGRWRPGSVPDYPMNVETLTSLSGGRLRPNENWGITLSS